MPGLKRAGTGQPVSLPPYGAGQRIGLMGGTFNPPHAGHLLVAHTALRRLGLDRIWWLVTPGNPLKNNSGLPPLAERMAAAKALVDDRRIVVSGLEAEIGTRFTWDTLRWLRERAPAVRFVWVMGADNLPNFHRWQRWTEIAALMPFAVVDRPGATLKATQSRVARRFADARIDESDASMLPDLPAPAWVFLHGPRSPLSSTALREAGQGLAAQSRPPSRAE
jgi:nicotinate-nucleotide adenylyltransferase